MMKMTLPYRRFFSLLGLALVAGILVISSVNDSRSRIATAEKLMLSQGRAIADIVAESSLHGIAAYNEFETEVSSRLINNALWVARVDSTHGLKTATLVELVQVMDLQRILVFDSAGKVEVSSHQAPAAGREMGNIPLEYLQPLLDGRQQSCSFGFRSAKRGGQKRFAAGVSRAGGGAIVVNIGAEIMTKVLMEVGPGHLIKSLGEGQGVKYVALQDENGIQASSTTEIGFYPPSVDPALKPLIEGEPYATRAFNSELGEIFEVNRVIKQSNGSDVLLRVGLDGSLLQQLRDDINRRTKMRGFIFLGSLILASSLMLAWQRQAVLDKEVIKIGKELQAKEEEARRAGKLVAMGTLAAGVAHQIRNPLNSIHMIAQMMRRRPDLPEKMEDQVGHIRDESSRIENIVQQFLEFAKPREPLMETVDLAELVSGAVSVQSSVHENDGIEVRISTEPVTAVLDRSFMIEVLENLMRNAAEALEGQGIIEITLRNSSDGAEIVVADNGPGIDAANRERIFDLYFTTRRQGTGLGLSLTAQMVSAMGGHLVLDHEPGVDGRGARFVIQLPKQRSQT
jgi:signal transduction histidine kinase